MYFVKADTPKNIKGYNRSKNYDLIKSFCKSGLKCAEVKDYTTKNAYYCAASLQHSIKLYKMAGVQAICRGGKVFLVNTLKEAEGKK